MYYPIFSFRKRRKTTQNDAAVTGEPSVPTIVDQQGHLRQHRVSICPKIQSSDLCIDNWFVWQSEPLPDPQAPHPDAAAAVHGGVIVIVMSNSNVIVKS